MSNSTKIWTWTLLLTPLQPRLARRGSATGLNTQVSRADVTREAYVKGSCCFSEAQNLFSALPSMWHSSPETVCRVLAQLIMLVRLESLHLRPVCFMQVLGRRCKEQAVMRLQRRMPP